MARVLLQEAGVLAEAAALTGSAPHATSPAAKELEVATGHLGLAVSIPGWTAIGEAPQWA